MKILVIDTGYFMEVPLELAYREQTETIYYYVDYNKDFPEIQKYAPGDGFIEIVKVRDYAAYIDEADLIVFPDVGYGGIADYLRKHGYRVYGASYLGQLLELDRKYMHEIASKLGIHRPETKVVEGLSNLLQYLREDTGKTHYVKVSTWRGNMETIKVTNPVDAEALLSTAGLGPYLEKLEFIVEEAIQENAVEIGADMFFNGKEIIRPYLFSPEVKDTITVTRWVNESPLDQLFIEKIEQWLAKTGYRGQISVEGFLTEDGKFYLLDVTARQPFPAGGVIAKSIPNYHEILYQIAEGEYPEIKPATEYGVEIVVGVEYPKLYLPVTIENEAETIRTSITPKIMARVRGRLWHLPGETVCGVVGLGASIEEAYNKAVEAVEKVHVQFAYDGRYGIHEFNKRKEKLREMGYNIF